MAVTGKTPNEEQASRPPTPEARPSAPESAVPAPESARTPEQTEATTTEMGAEKETPRAAETPPPPVPMAPAAHAPAPATPKDEFTQEIESILSEDMTDLFLKMNPAQQDAFKKRGEVTAGKVRELLSKAKVNVGNVLKLIRDWLKMIPGVNKFFLEQAAKIKTDKVLDAREDRRQKGLL